MVKAIAGLIVCVIGTLTLAQTQSPKVRLTMDRVMTQKELRESGLSSLTPQQRKALDDWLNRYTEVVIRATGHVAETQPRLPRLGHTSSDCTPAVESTISGDFEGWSGETIFKLDNGQIWEQAEYDYTYDYQYRPDVVIYPGGGGCRMKVEGLEETIVVRRIR